jgi:hypothetical protein
MSVQLDGAGEPGSRHEAVPGAAARPWMMLGLATVGFAVNFWAWALLSPLGPHLKDSLHLSTVQQALVVAVPVVVGSLAPLHRLPQPAGNPARRTRHQRPPLAEDRGALLARALPPCRSTARAPSDPGRGAPAAAGTRP